MSESAASRIISARAKSALVVIFKLSASPSKTLTRWPAHSANAASSVKLPRRTPGGRGQQVFETSNRLPVAFVIGGVDDWLDEIDTRMHEKGAQRRPDHRLAANGPILLWNVRSSAFAAPRCHNHGSHCPGH